MNNYPPPYLYGAPLRFTEWRSGQFEAVQASLASKKRIVVHDAPPGFGKTMLVMGEMLISNRRMLIDTSSKFLQEQYNHEWSEETGLFDIKGRSNYSCEWEHISLEERLKFTRELQAWGNPGEGISRENSSSGPTISVGSKSTGRFHELSGDRSSNSSRATTAPRESCKCSRNSSNPTTANGCTSNGHYVRAADKRKSESKSDRNERCVAHAPCQIGIITKRECELYTEGGCQYYDRIKASKWKQRVITNYSLNISSNLHSEGLGQFSTVVWDEGHSVPQALSDAVKFELSEYEMKVLLRLPKYRTMTISEWAVKATTLRGWMANRIETATRMGDAQALIGLKRLKLKLDIMSLWVNDNWVIEDTPKGGKEFTPIYPSDFRELLINGANKILIVSATIRPKILEQIGLDISDVDYFEYDCPFPTWRRPIYVMPTTKMNYESSEEDIRRIVQRTDQIIARRLDRKGIIPTVSYRLQEIFLKYSMFKDLMIAPKSAQELPAALSELKRRTGPCVLVGPNFSTGVDLPHDYCRYVIVPKLPYSNSQNAVFRARCEADKDYGTFMMVQELVQSLWRGMRSELDWCEGFILDSNIENVLEYNRKMFQRWFLSAIKYTDAVPDAMII